MLDLEDRADVTIVRLRHGKVNALDLELLLAIPAARRGSWRGFRLTCSRSASGSYSSRPATGSPPGAATRRPSRRCGQPITPGTR